MINEFLEFYGISYYHTLDLRKRARSVLLHTLMPPSPSIYESNYPEVQDRKQSESKFVKNKFLKKDIRIKNNVHSSQVS